MRGLIQALSATLSRTAARFIPDPLVIALILSALILGGAALGSDLGFWGAIDAWGGRLRNGEALAREQGVWRLLAFAMQMCLVLVTGHALASAPVARSAIKRITSAVQSPAQAIAVTAYIAMLGGLLNWGLGLILGAMTAREMGISCARRQIAVHYPLICAAGYTGLLVWHGGLSGTAPLKVTQLKELTDVFGAAFVEQHQLRALSLYETLGSALNLWVMGGLLVAVPLLLIAMLPRVEDRRAAPASLIMSTDELASSPESAESLTPAQRLERSSLIAYGFALIILIYVGRYIGHVGLGRLDLNIINLSFIGLGFLAYGAPLAYGQAIERATRGCAGILIQFPLYAGIMALMATSGFTASIARSFTALASADSLGALSFFAAGIINICVPSGGGQWAVQGPLLLESAQQLGAPHAEVVMAFAYGDAWTNMLQPFWALPLLVLTEVEARDIVGYSATLMLLVTPIYLLGFWLF